MPSFQPAVEPDSEVVGNRWIGPSVHAASCLQEIEFETEWILYSSLHESLMIRTTHMVGLKKVSANESSSRDGIPSGILLDSKVLKGTNIRGAGYPGSSMLVIPSADADIIEENGVGFRRSRSPLKVHASRQEIFWLSKGRTSVDKKNYSHCL
ncbi:4989_t:CDS:2 [Acaulospora colombiana]|uniref:4989_t:CDS:1 n=1 Tax=Acaulospora colombiana TaxID=27376 RepID=A0ACA9KSW6_9GLOM|nr:4989_t:CDS:2 [Acaulospora colombiana]